MFRELNEILAIAISNCGIALLGIGLYQDSIPCVYLSVFMFLAAIAFFINSILYRRRPWYGKRSREEYNRKISELDAQLRKLGLL